MGETPKKRRLSEGSETAQDVDVAKNSPQQDATAQQPTARKPRRELFIRSLPTTATSESLAEHFSQSYVIKHAFVVNDSETKQSKGYGFVTFADVEDAQNALEEFNGSVFDGKKIKVDYAEPRHREIDGEHGKSVPSSAASKFKQDREQQRESTQPPKLIVRNLPWSIKEPEDLAVHFRSFGKVKYATIPKRGNKLAGFGFVVLRGKKNAEKALESVNGKEVDGRTLAVDWAVEKNVWENLQKESQEQEEDKGEDDAGDIEMADDAEAEASSEDEDPTGSDEDMEDLDEDAEELGEDEDEEEEEEEEDERNALTIFIRNLPFTCTDEALYEHFRQFGPLHYARTVVDPETERPRGTGFVCFRNIEDSISCVRDAPKQTDTVAQEKGKGNKGSSAVKHSVLQNENADPTGRYTLDGRVLQVARAVSKSQATKLEEEGASRRFDRDKDKRRVFLLSEGTIPTNSALYKKLSPSEVKMREDSFKQRQSFIKKNPTLHLSLTRLSIRNIPRHVTSKDLKALAREAVVGFAKDAKTGVRLPLSKEELARSTEAMKEADHLRKQKRQGIVRQAKVVFEGRDGSKVGEESGAGRSRGYGFIEYFTHRHALMGLRWLNGHAVEAPPTDEVKDRKKRLIVEFAIENAQVVKRRNEYQAKAQARNAAKAAQQNDKTGNAGKPSSTDNANSGKKRKRSDKGANGKGEGGNGDAEEENKIAKRNRIIAKKRMQRKSRKGKA